MKPLIVEIDVSQGPESPCANGGWQLHSFARNKFVTDVDPDEYVGNYDRATGDVTPATDDLKAKLAAGLAFWLSYFEHGDGQWSLKGEGQQCRFDGTKLAGILVWEEGEEFAPKKEEREAHARRFLEAYSEWANGYVYDWSVREPGSDDPIESVAETIGTDDMMKSIVELVGDRPIIARGDCKWMLTDRNGLYAGKTFEVMDEEDLVESLLADDE